jgi:hypothetical protein
VSAPVICFIVCVHVIVCARLFHAFVVRFLKGTRAHEFLVCVFVCMPLECVWKDGVCVCVDVCARVYRMLTV